MQHEIENSCKIRDQVLRVAVTLKLFEMSLEFLNNWPNFDFGCLESGNCIQPLSPNAAKMQVKHLTCATISLEACYQKKHTI